MISSEDGSDMAPLHRISHSREKATDEDNYTYPLYILKEKDAAIDRFWEQKSDYTSVIRVHHSYDIGGDLVQKKINK